MSNNAKVLNREEFVHFRLFQPDGSMTQYGGLTVCYQPNNIDGTASFAVAMCSITERFNRKRGVTISRGRSLKASRTNAGYLDKCPRTVMINKAIDLAEHLWDDQSSQWEWPETMDRCSLRQQRRH